ncbi:exodeoxyribonuclease VII large subunit [Litoreibacter roseus]|uniref:Exodeoxyribonuclease 7 large subunit n=1 Tax=Litoreibacter roseus TaxID=2601869 RepID=A0A6N6JKY2_9RHOB|nr:exodeoxyribonuclease VII large subunit [Litoreibacter roseus]GFE65938.1 exodeoxyribonuclease 7 large subunit [Litoreibacter roseus]
MDLIEDDAPGRNEPEFTVSEISGAVKRTIEGEFGRVRVKGECGRVMIARSGHVYLDLKDDRAVLSSVIWKGQAARLAVQPEEGMEVVAVGRLTTFPGQSRYQMVIEDIRPAGVGALMAMLEKRKKVLEAEGLFAAERKKPIPFLPDVIGVVTSPQGAVIRDILHRLRDRFPRKVLIWPVAVQGEACAPQVTAAIQGFNALEQGGAVPRPDLIIVARGGGSIEDLWGFNEENVARAAAASEIPLISAVGHETDTTLIDYVSDRRAPTPTAAAEMAVPVRLELLSTLDSYDSRLTRALATMIQNKGQRLRDMARALPRPDELTQNAAQRLDAAAVRLPTALRAATQTRRVALERAAAPLRPNLLRQKTSQMADRLSRISDGLNRALTTRVEREHGRLDRMSAGLVPHRLRQDLASQADRMARTNRAFNAAARAQLNTWTRDLTRLDQLRETLGYQATLDRGYAVIWSDEKVVTTKKAAKAAKALEIQFKDGRFTPTTIPRKAKAASKPPSQGSLFDE